MFYFLTFNNSLFELWSNFKSLDWAGEIHYYEQISQIKNYFTWDNLLSLKFILNKISLK